VSHVTPTAADAVGAALPFHQKWWTYQRERFPLLGHGLLIASFSFCAVSLSRMLRDEAGWPAWPQLIVAFGTCFTFFLQLRLADEFKDYHEDMKFRPYRPVQRGLVTLRELGVLFVLCGLFQLLLALWLDPKLIVLLAVTWVYLALMSKEFFVEEWLRNRHVLYMVSHMVIMPLVDLYATSSDWLPVQNHAPTGLIWFLLASYFNGIVIELGRKIRSPMDEEHGVSTYSILWGRSGAVAAWWGAMLMTALFAIVVAVRLNQWVSIGVVLATFLLIAGFVGILFLRSPVQKRGNYIETCSGLWTITLYLSLGLLPHFLQRSGQ
jgi:4-hydroxybenzoate polyprenyltransferase